MSDKRKLQLELAEITHATGWDNDPKNVEIARKIAKKLITDEKPRKKHTIQLFSESEQKEMVWMYLNEKSIRSIYEKFHTTRPVVTNILKKTGAYMEKKKQREELIDVMITDYQNGVPISVLEKRYQGMNVWNLLHTRGVIGPRKIEHPKYMN